MTEYHSWSKDWFLDRARTLLENNKAIIKELKKDHSAEKASMALYNIGEVFACLSAAEDKDADISTLP